MMLLWIFAAASHTSVISSSVSMPKKAQNTVGTGCGFGPAQARKDVRRQQPQSCSEMSTKSQTCSRCASCNDAWSTPDC